MLFPDGIAGGAVGVGGGGGGGGDYGAGAGDQQSLSPAKSA